MAQHIHLAIASTTSQPGALEENLEQITAFARRAGQDGAHLLLTPEMSATGYGNYPEVLALAEVAGEGPIYRALSQAARETNVVICAGFAEQNADKSSDRKHLSHYAIYPDGNFIVQRKHCLTNSETPLEAEFPQRPPFREDGTGAPSQSDFKVFEVEGINCAVVICADAGIENVRGNLASRGVRVLLLPTGAGGNREDRVTDAELQTRAGRETYARVLETVFFPGRDAILQSIEHNQVLAAVNLGASDGRKHHHLGHGMIINAKGEVPGFYHGQPNFDRQKPMFASARIEIEDRL